MCDSLSLSRSRVNIEHKSVQVVLWQMFSLSVEFWLWKHRVMIFWLTWFVKAQSYDILIDMICESTELWYSDWHDLWKHRIGSYCKLETLFLNFLMQTLVALTMATLFLHSEKSSEKGVQQRDGYISFTLAFLIFTSTEALPVFLNERQIFIRETSRGAYRASSYAVSQSIVILPFLFVLAALYSLISYFAIGLVTNVGAYFFFVLLLFLTLAVSNALVSFVATIVPDFSAGATLATAICAYFFLFAGFFILRYIYPYISVHMLLRIRLSHLFLNVLTWAITINMVVFNAISSSSQKS